MNLTLEHNEFSPSSIIFLFCFLQGFLPCVCITQSFSIFKHSLSLFCGMLGGMYGNVEIHIQIYTETADKNIIFFLFVMFKYIYPKHSLGAKSAHIKP